MLEQINKPKQTNSGLLREFESCTLKETNNNSEKLRLKMIDDIKKGLLK